MSRYPVIYAGQRITGALLQSMIPDEIQKLVNTDRNSTTTVADDPDLTTTLEANARYFIEFELWYAATNASGGIKTAWTVPSGVTGNRSALGLADSVSSGVPEGSGRFGVHAFTTAVAYGDRASSTNLVVAKECALLTTASSSGTCALQWAQNVSDAANCRMGAGSLMRVTRLA
jgi:hypothetical protein